MNDRFSLTQHGWLVHVSCQQRNLAFLQLVEFTWTLILSKVQRDVFLSQTSSGEKTLFPLLYVGDLVWAALGPPLLGLKIGTLIKLFIESVQFGDSFASQRLISNEWKWQVMKGPMVCQRRKAMQVNSTSQVVYPHGTNTWNQHMAVSQSNSVARLYSTLCYK